MQVSSVFASLSHNILGVFNKLLCIVIFLSDIYLTLLILLLLALIVGLYIPFWSVKLSPDYSELWSAPGAFYTESQCWGSSQRRRGGCRRRAPWSGCRAPWWSRRGSSGGRSARSSRGRRGSSSLRLPGSLCRRTFLSTKHTWHRQVHISSNCQ